MYFNGTILLELSVISLSLNSMDTLSGVSGRFDFKLFTDVLLTLDSLLFADFLLDTERGRGTGTVTSLFSVISKLVKN